MLPRSRHSKTALMRCWKHQNINHYGEWIIITAFDLRLILTDIKTMMNSIKPPKADSGFRIRGSGITDFSGYSYR